MSLLKTLLCVPGGSLSSHREELWAVTDAQTTLRIVRTSVERLPTLTACSSPTSTQSATSCPPVIVWSRVMVVSVALPTLFCQIARIQPLGQPPCHQPLWVQPSEQPPCHQLLWVQPSEQPPCHQLLWVQPLEQQPWI